MRRYALVLPLAFTLSAQSPSDEAPPPAANRRETRSQPGPCRQIANGAGNVGTGAAKGAGDLAKGGAKAAGNLVTLHPISAAASVGRGAVSAGKDVGVGTAKGTGKMAKGLGRAIKSIW